MALTAQIDVGHNMLWLENENIILLLVCTGKQIFVSSGIVCK